MLLALIVFPTRRADFEFAVVRTEVIDTKGLETVDNLKVQPADLDESVVNDLAAVDVPTRNIAPEPSLLDIDVNQEQIRYETEADEFLGQPHKEGDLAGRSAQARMMLARAFGGSATSEACVASGLYWLARHQKQDGSWSFDHRSSECDDTCSDPGELTESTVAATSMALLCYLGAGHTHESGKYQPQVQRGLNFLLTEFEKSGRTGDMRQTSSGTSGMYAHALATIAFCEAYGMTNDRDVGKVAQACVNFLLAAQNLQNGGWRYQPQSKTSDTSIVGWAVMAMTSAQMAHLAVPERHPNRAGDFLDSVQLEKGAYYGYTHPQKKASTTAIGLLCRMYLGWNRNRPALGDGVEFLSAQGPSRENMYFNYYATQVLHHWGGEEWVKWNEVMRHQLISTQTKTGHAAGSWAPRDPHGATGGRLYMTCLAVLTLEVYYRHLPLYQRRSVNADL